MEKSGSTDEFFGDQSSESGCDNSDMRQRTSSDEAKSNAFGSAAGHDYRSQESSIKTLSYLDGFDETKHEKLQDGFCDGYKQAVGDAFRVGQQFGLLSAKVAFKESSTLMQHLQHLSDDCVYNEGSKSNLHSAAALIHQFLTEEILTGSSDKEKDGYTDSLSNLSIRLEKNSIN